MKRAKQHDVAIVGMACRFPDANNYESYWQNLVAKKNSIQVVPAERWDVSVHYSPEKNQKSKSISKWCGLIEDIKSFDNDFFNISPIEARNMDPQQRLLLQESWRCIEDSSIPLSTLQKAKTSVFVGAMTSDYLQTLNKSEDANNRYSILGNDHCILANRISHQLNLSGESISINAASASSLVAIHKAKSSLILGECDFAIAAGVNLNTDPFKYIVFSQAGMLSPDGQCKSFSDDANGYVPGDGVAALLLQPLEQAIENNHHIYGVIKGSAINHIGSGKSITAPCANAQARVISDALENAGKSVSDVGYIEAHGSGTPLGDPVEIEAINRVFKKSEADLIIGTVKPNIGHLEAAAGIAGVIKALQVLKHQYIPANLNLNKINPVLNLNGTKLKLAAGDLLNTFDKSCVGVSSFGFGGVSCHLVLEKFNADSQNSNAMLANSDTNHFLLSAKSKSSLKNSIQNWQQYLQTSESNSSYINDICASVATGREQFPYRVGFTVSGKDQLFKQLSDVELTNDKSRQFYSFVFADNKGSDLKSKIPLINEHYDRLLQQVESSEQYDDKKASNVFRSTDFKSTLLSVAIFNALQDLKIFPSLIEQIGQSVWSALLSSEAVDLDDYLAVVLHNKKLSDVCYYHPKYPLKISHKSKTFYPEYINQVFMRRFFNEVKNQQQSYQNIIDQANALLVNNITFIEILSVWNYTNEAEGDLLSTLQNFSQTLKEDVQKAAYAVVAANVSLNRFYQKWMFECGDSQDYYHITFLSELISRKILSHSGFYRISQKPPIEAEKTLVELNRRYWRKINQLVCEVEKHQHKKNIKVKTALISAIESEELQLSRNPNKIHRISIGQVPVDLKEDINHEIFEVQQWQQNLLEYWLQGNHVNWYKVYPYASFKSLPLPGYVFDKVDFWTTATQQEPEQVIIEPKSVTETIDGREPVFEGVTKDKPDDSLTHLTQAVTALFAEQISLDKNKVNLNKSLETFGLDSMAYTELCDQVNDDFKTTLTPACFYGFKNVQGLIDHIYQQLGTATEELNTAEQLKGDKQEQVKPAEVKPAELKSEEQQSEEHLDSQDVAIIGYAGQLPNADSLEQFWSNIMAGVDGITEVPKLRWNWQDYYSKDLRETNKTPSKWGGFISDIEFFDAAFFGISPQEAKLMDPQQRILLQTVWHAIEHSGHQPASFAGSQTGVFVGASTSDYEEIIRNNELVAHASTGMNRSIIANRISFVLDLQGPSEVIDTACSSSLVAIHKAVQSIRSGDCQVAFAGGVNALISPTHYISYGKAGMLSPEGKCKTFDKDANGYVRAEGVGVVVLKSMSQAIEDNDMIHAVIKASGTNHGGKASSLTAPNPNAQAQLIFDTYHKAGIKSHSIDYIENHGTGTPLGDPIEINGLNLAFERLEKTEGSNQHICKLASVKSNIGHLEAAAGIAGVLKVILALKHEFLPASQNIKTLNPFIKLDKSRFEILQQNQPWPSGPEHKVRRAGISSFGFGGVNAHIVLEEFANKQKTDNKHKPNNKQVAEEVSQCIVVLSAKTMSSLKVYTQNYLDYLGHGIAPDVSIQQIAFTSQLGRNHEKYRLAVCASSRSELLMGLEDYIKQKDSSNFFFGQIDAEKTLSMFDDKLAILWKKGAFKTLAKLWVKGLHIDWKVFYTNRNDMQRVVLPVYPFSKQPHWLTKKVKPSENDSKTISSKNEESKEVVNIKTQEVVNKIKPYVYEVLKDHYIGTEHVVDGVAIAPGVFSLELVYTALQLAGIGINEVVLEDVFWKAPIVFDGSDKRLSVINKGNESGHLFEIQTLKTSNDKPVIFTQLKCVDGKVLGNNLIQPDLKQFKPIQITDIYGKLSEVGFSYGSHFRVIEQVLYHRGQYIAKLRLSEIFPSNDTYVVDPRLLDGALQTCLVGLVDQGLLKQSNKWSFVPMMIKQFQVIKKMPEIVYVYMQSDVVLKKQQDSCAFNLQIVDSKKRICVEIKQVVFKQFIKTQSFTKHSLKSAVSIKKNRAELSNNIQENLDMAKEGEFKSNKPMRNQAVSSQAMSNQSLFDRTTEYFINNIAEIASLEPSEVDVKQSFKEYGIDSFLTLSIIRNLEDDFGDLRKTLLFEASNINELVAIFISEHQQTLKTMFNLELVDDQTAQEGDFVSKDTAENRNHEELANLGDEQVVKEVDEQIIDEISFTDVFEETNETLADIETDNELAQSFCIFKSQSLEKVPHQAKIIQALFSQYGGESVALSRKDIAPYVFLCGKEQGLFYFNTHKDILLAFRYVGPDDYFLEAITELKAYCKTNKLKLNVLSETSLTETLKHGLSANSFGVIQRLPLIAEFSIKGSKMRRLRYQVNKFQQSGAAKTIEYKVGVDVATDDVVAGMIEKWAGIKSGVNPYIWRVKDEMETGCLGDAYRIFLTYLDNSLQNVVIVSRIESENSYLLDTEFYSNEMAVGAMEFGIVEIIKLLREEGCDAFSLGLTFGASFIESNQADPAVRKSFEKLAEDGIFEEAGNFQFKNKFRCVNSPLFLYRTEDQAPSNVIDIIMMIGNPHSAKPLSPVIETHNSGIEATHQEQVVPKTSNTGILKQAFTTEPQAPLKSLAPMIPMKLADKSVVLKAAGYNPFNLIREEIEYDLATDSWSELEYPFIKQRTELLQSKNQNSELHLEDMITEVFGLPYVLPFSAGRVAESFFCPAWPKNKKYVLQNALFPTCLFHQVNNDFIPVEVVDREFDNFHSNHIFKGNLNCKELSSKLEEYDNDVALVWVELANNAAGGCPVSISNLREIKSLIGDIPLVIDATRIVENAYHIATYEKEYLGHDIWSIVKEICSYADAVNASLTKDFGTHIGGFFATRDIDLYAQIQDAVSTNGSGLSRMDRQLVCQAVEDKTYILNAVKKRMDAVSQLAQLLVSGGVSVAQPIGGHCVLIDPMTIDGLSELATPLPSFLAWLYQNTGIRAGVHSVGRQRNTAMNDLVRLAIPVGISSEQIQDMAGRLITLFTTDSQIDELTLKNKPQGLFGEMKASYVVNESVQLNLSDNLVKKSVSSQSNFEQSVKPIENKVDDKAQDNYQSINDKAAHNRNQEKPSMNDSSMGSRDIAVIGMSGRYPDADNLTQFWENLTQGQNSIKMGPDWASRFIDENSSQHFGGFIDDVDKFDSLFFSISPREAENMDPQERMMMEVSWEALEDAGYHPESLADTLGSNQVGVFVGAVWSYYEMLGAENRQLGGGSIANSQHWGISNRVSSFMNFSGPSLTVDTACSSSLTAIHLACESIRSGECQVALAGGVNLDLHPSKHHITHAAQFLSDDGLCRAFGRGGSGYVAGEGVGTLVLKPLSQAELDGDHIYGVIKSTATNHGGRTAGYTVPSPNAQAALISSAIEKANISAETISYVEAHGTGTELGDPVEIQGATKAYRKHTQAKQYCSIGSVKTNIGHLEAAAGIAGATKLLLQMKHKLLVPSLHSQELNEYIDFKNSPFYVQQEKTYWQPLEVDGEIIPRRAGLSSFGAGGTNVHIIFEEYQVKNRISSPIQEQLLFVLSARKEEQLNIQAVNLLAWLEDSENSDVNLAELAYTLQAGRLPMGKRMATSSTSKDILINNLKDFINNEHNEDVYLADPNTKFALDLFNGNESKQIIDVLVNNGSFNKLAKLWVNGVDISWSHANKNVYRKISLPTYPFAKESHWINQLVGKGIAAHTTQTHTLPKKSAAVIHPLIDKNLSTSNYQEYQKTFNLNQFVFSDHIVDGLPTLPGVAYMEMARAAAEHASSFQVSALENLIWASPINTQSSQDIRIKLNTNSANDDITDYEICTFDNAGKKHIHSQGKAVCVPQTHSILPSKDIPAIKERCNGYLSKTECYDLLATRKLRYGAPLQSINGFHYGHKEGLTKLKLPTDLIASFSDYQAHPSILDGAVQSIISLLEYVDTKTQSGVPYVPFVLSELLIHKPLTQNGYAHLTLDEGKKERDDIKKISIDIMNDEGEILIQMKDFSFKAISEQVPAESILPARKNIFDQQDVVVYQRSWQVKDIKDSQKIISDDETLVLFDNNLRNKQELTSSKNNHFKFVVLVGTHESFLKIDKGHYQLNPTDTSHLQKLMDSLLADDLVPTQFIHNLANHAYSEEVTSIENDLNNGLYSVFSLSQILLKNRKAFGSNSKSSKSLGLTYLYHCQDDLTQPSNGAVNAFMRSIKHEGANIDCKTICINHESSDNIHMMVNWEFVLQEIMQNDDIEVMFKENQRFSRNLKAVSVIDEVQSKPSCELTRDGGVYLITGGAGGLGLIFAEEMVKTTGVKLILTGRSDSNDFIEAKLNKLKGHVEYHSCDLTDAMSVNELITKTTEKHGHLDGVIHAAGIIKDGFLWNKELPQFASVLAAKIMGTNHLDQATKEMDLDYFILCSSIASVIGNMGQSDYAAGNRFMDDFAVLRSCWQQQGLRKGRSISINWPLWKSGGMQVNDQAEQWMFDNWGMKPLATDVGLNGLKMAIQTDIPVLGLIQGDVEKIHQALTIDTISVDSTSINSTANNQKQSATVEPVKKTVNSDIKAESTVEVQVTPNDQVSLIENLQVDLTDMVVELLKINQSDITFTDNMSTYGFDSVTFTEFANLINSRLEIDVTPLIFFEQETLDELTEYLLEDFAESLSVHYEKVSEMVESVTEKPLGMITQERISEDSIFQVSNSNHSVHHYPGQNKDLKHLEQNSGEATPPKNNEKSQNNEDIAIIGMSGVMPQSADLDVFWQNLIDERNLVTEIPKDRWDWKKFYGESDLGNSKTEIKWGGFMPDVDKFDAEFFNISPLEAELTDPQQRIFLQSVWHAIEDSGYKTKELSGSNTGVFVGIGSSDYHELLREESSDFEAYSVAGWMHAVLANRISYFFNWSGPSEPIGTACSSTLVAVDRAVRAIRSGQCDMCVAGGVSMLLNPGVHVGLGKASMLADDGRCKSFDHKANGYVRSEGVGALILKPLSQAKADGDRIHAVIKGTAVNHGGHVNTFTTPNPKAQAEVLNMAFNDAQIDPATLTYIETHGTGTALGDPIEIQGLLKAFKNSANKTDEMPELAEYCTLGSVKTNAGHLELASGMAGISKLILCLKNKVIPANINFEKINPYIKLEKTPFRLATETKAWSQISDTQGQLVPRRAGISSFGFGGVNAHLVLEEYNEQEERVGLIGLDEKASLNQVVVISAKYTKGLEIQAKRLIAYINKNHENKTLPSLETLAAGYQQGRDDMSERLALVVGSYTELLNCLESYCNGEVLKNVFQSKQTVKTQLDSTEVNKWLADKNVHSLAESWVCGNEIDWQQLNPRSEKITLPVYPFQKNRYWLLDNSYTGAISDGEMDSAEMDSAEVDSAKTDSAIELSDQGIQISLLENETVGDNKTTFEVLVDESSCYLQDHQIAGFKLLPAAGYLELVNHALNIIENINVGHFHGIQWIEPATLESINHGLQLKLTKDDGRFEFVFATKGSNKQQEVYCRGYAVTADEKAQVAEKFDKKLLGSIAFERKEIYRVFEKAGFEYGESLQVINRMNVDHERKVFAELKLPKTDDSKVNHNLFHTAVVDGTLQCMLGVLLFQVSEKNIQVPVTVHEIEWLKPLTETSYVAIKEIGQNLNQSKQVESRIFDIQIYDSAGQLSVKLESFEIRNLINTKEAKAAVIEETVEKGTVLSKEKTVEFLSRMIAEETKRELVGIDVNASFEGFGIDSFLALRMTKKLEKVVGSVSKTVFFEHTTVNDLADYLVKTHSDVLNGDLNENVVIAQTDQFVPTVNNLIDATVIFLTELVSAETKRDKTSIKADAPLESLGIDSFLALRMTKTIEKKLGPVPKAMFFEHNSIQSLAEYLVQEHKVMLESILELTSEPSTPVSSGVVANKVQSPDVSLADATVVFLTELVSAETKRDKASIKADAPLESLGIDSFLALRMTKNIEKKVGPVPKAIFFEHSSIQSLAQYLAKEYKEPLVSAFKVDSIDDPVEIEKDEDNEVQSLTKEDGLVDVVSGFLKKMIAEETKREESNISIDANFDGFGIDSFLALRMTKKLEKMVGKISKTVFFEYKNIESLTKYLISEHSSALAELLDVGAAEVVDINEKVELENQQPLDLLPEKTAEYLAEIIATETKRSSANIKYDVALDSYGVDSFLALRMTKKLEKIVGQISKSVFFEHRTIDDLASYLITVHETELKEHFNIDIAKVDLKQGYAVSNQPSIPTGMNNNDAISKNAAAELKNKVNQPLVIKEAEIHENPDVAETIELLFQKYGKENKALARNAIAPLIFVGSDSTAYFNFNIAGGVALAFTYVGADSELEKLANEFTDYCIDEGLLANMLLEQVLNNQTSHAFSSNPFGMMQRLNDIKGVSLQGSKMRRLRYQISKFKQSGQCEFLEYDNGDDKFIDESIANMIDQWAATKTMVNPYIWQVKDTILKGTLSDPHRIFLTEIDGVLQNAIIITRLASGEGYLMDLEFYSKDMPLGGLEYSIWHILQKLSTEGHEAFSLGATFGVIDDNQVEADPAVTNVLAELQEQGVFDGKGNLQFKNKFRPENKTLFLVRPLDDDPEKVIDVIMMIANPVMEDSISTQNNKS